MREHEQVSDTDAIVERILTVEQRRLGLHAPTR
jgi:hypothetical protein